MKFVCERCHTKYSIADEKVRGKVLKVRCKTCTNVITVRETGATIEDAGATGPREPAVTKSGSFDEGAAPTVANAAAIAKAAARSAKPAGLPAEALSAPGTPAAAPPRRPTPPPIPPLDDVEWYLAVDGAQTGPFSRARLVDKILIQPKEADVHIWNSTFDAWKPPKDVAEVDAEVRKRRGAPTVPPPPVRRPSGALPLAAAPASAGGDLGGGGGAHLGAVGAGMAALDSGGHGSRLPARGKKNGTAPGLAVGAAVSSTSASAEPGQFDLGDLLGDAGLTPPPSATAALANGPGLFDPVMLTPPPSAAASPAVVAATAAAVASAAAPVVAPAVVAAPAAGPRVSKGKPIKLLLGAAAVVVVVCGIVLFSMFRKPTTSSAASPPSGKPSGTDFAGLAEKLAKEEAEKTPPPPPPVEAPPPPVVDVKSVAAKEPPGKGGRGKKQPHRSTAPPPLGATSPPPPSSSGLTADQRAAASRFGESTGREVRVPTSTSGSAAHSTPAQGDISRVINNNRQGIQTCYQRALLRDNTLTHGKVTVRVSIGLSGKVKSVSLDAPAQFRALEPCIRDVMSRWAFPPSSEEYGTEFPVVLQGNN